MVKSNALQARKIAQLEAQVRELQRGQTEAKAELGVRRAAGMAAELRVQALPTQEMQLLVIGAELSTLAYGREGHKSGAVTCPSDCGTLKAEVTVNTALPGDAR